MKKPKLVLLIIFLSVLLTAASLPFSIQSNFTQTDDLTLAERFAPVLYFHPEEVFRPQTVDVLVGTARLRQDISFWFDANILNEVTLVDLLTYHHPHFFLDVWYGSSGASDYKNYSSHRAYYQENLSPQAGGPPVSGYARVIRDQVNQKVVIQYWLFYFYNDWFNKHEGDWEFVQVILDQDSQPEWVVLSQHHGGTRRAWEHIQVEDGTHPAVYVALGSHANYFWGDEIYPNGQDIGEERIEILDRTGTSSRVIPAFSLLPDHLDFLRRPADFPLLEWLVFSGSWGERAFQGDFSGPVGPAAKGVQWDQAYQWGLEQPLDTEIWYHNRLRVEVKTNPAVPTQITLQTTEGFLDNTEHAVNPAILHSDPPLGSVITASLQGLPPDSFEIIVTQPVPQTAVNRYSFNLPAGLEEDSLSIIIPATGPPVIHLTNGEILSPNTSATQPATWDAPDLIWFAGYLPAGQVVLGILLSLAAGIIPGLLYAGLLYWSDRYEKEPRRMVAAALLWGAIPAVLVALAARLFFQLPVGLSGSSAVDALQAGVLTPLIEELLKGSMVLLFAFRFRREFDNILDGVIYGAMVGFGYSMTANTIGYLGAFLLRGFGGLGMTMMVEGLFFGLNHAMYTAIFGAALGYARLSENKSTKILIPLFGFIFAVVANASHKLVVNSVLGFNFLSLTVNWLGIGLVIIISIWSLHRQRQVLIEELSQEIPPEMLYNLIHPRLKRISLREIKKQGGAEAKRRLQQHYQILAEYAFKKMQHRRFPEDGLSEELENLRQEIRKYPQP